MLVLTLRIMMQDALAVALSFDALDTEPGWDDVTVNQCTDETCRFVPLFKPRAAVPLQWGFTLMCVCAARQSSWSSSRVQTGPRYVERERVPNSQNADPDLLPDLQATSFISWTGVMQVVFTAGSTALHLCQTHVRTFGGSRFSSTSVRFGDTAMSRTLALLLLRLGVTVCTRY